MIQSLGIPSRTKYAEFITIGISFLGVVSANDVFAVKVADLLRAFMTSRIILHFALVKTLFNMFRNNLPAQYLATYHTIQQKIIGRRRISFRTLHRFCLFYGLTELLLLVCYGVKISLTLGQLLLQFGNFLATHLVSGACPTRWH